MGLAGHDQSHPTVFIPHSGLITLSKQITIYSCINRIDDYAL